MTKTEALSNTSFVIKFMRITHVLCLDLFKGTVWHFRLETKSYMIAQHFIWRTVCDMKPSLWMFFEWNITTLSNATQLMLAFQAKQKV